MPKTITVSALQKKISRELRDAGSGRKLAVQYGVNQRYISDALHGVAIHNQEVRYIFGLDQRPKPAWLKTAVAFLAQRDQGEPIVGPRVYARGGRLVWHDEG